MTRHEKILGALILSIVMLAFLFLPLSKASPSPQANIESYRQKVTLTATGSDGSATGTATSGYLRGYLRAIYVDYGASVTSTTDLTITTSSPAATVFVKSDSSTDAWYYPAVQWTGANASAISGAYGRFPVDDYLSISAGESTSGTVATIWIEYGD